MKRETNITTAPVGRSVLAAVVHATLALGLVHALAYSAAAGATPLLSSIEINGFVRADTPSAQEFVSISDLGNYRAEVATENHGDSRTARTTALAQGSYGGLGVSATAFTEGVNFFGITDQGGISSKAQLQIVARDELILVCSGIGCAPGTPVLVSFRLTLDSTVTASGDGTARGSVGTSLLLNDSESSPFYLSIGDTDFSDPASRSVVSRVVTVRIGDHLTLVHAMQLDALAEVGLSNEGTASVDVSAGQSAHAFIEIQTPGVGLETGSGYLYSSTPAAVPEPATWALVCLGLAGLRFRTRRTLFSIR